MVMATDRVVLCDPCHTRRQHGSHLDSTLRAIIQMLEECLVEDAMVSQDYLFMVLLVIGVLYFMHWGGGHSLRH